MPENSQTSGRSVVSGARGASRDLFARIRIASESAMRETAASRLASLSAHGSSWTKLATATIEASISGSPTALIDPGIGVLRALVGLESDEDRMLMTIERDVEILREGPFLVACDLVDEASRSHDATQGETLLNEAANEFRRARRNAASQVEQGVVEAHLGYTQLLLGHREECQHRLREAHDRLNGEASRLLAKSGDIKVLNSRRSTLAVALYYPVGAVILARKVIKVRNAERARLALVELQPVLTALSRSVQALGGEALPAYEMAMSGSGWTLQPIVPSLGSAFPPPTVA